MTRRLFDLCGRDRNLRFSPYCWRAKMALAHKGLEFETVPTPFLGVAAIEPDVVRTVPVLDDHGVRVRDSFEIAVHLEHAYPDRAPLFAAADGIAAARFMESATFATLHPPILRMIVKDIHDQLDDADQEYFRESRESRLGLPLEEAQQDVGLVSPELDKALAPLRRTLEFHPWLAGEQPGFVDYIPFGTLMWLAVIHGGLPIDPDDAVADWFGRCLDLHDGLARGARFAA
ncbi:glutathione S-transferase N-terminal domain-containing protein [Afifella sp. H1R]|uniref:glutathione S-transferase N-terminal domain-containing protein n=1 Tax=Afifella sp. H1R TaxID=2908841 RepID=UPI001F1E423D|nr:glutathione S-transferase N-terminal domain-containing protein [Afifella sp. H1R]MCF1503925.1 glutathione S-transferase N-terminal domain-containing protein [Afifella sp. H1R]